MGESARPRLCCGVTAGISAWALLRGQLADMAQRGWDVVVVADGADGRLAPAAEREGVRHRALRMSREIDLFADLSALCAWVRLLRQERPDVLSVGTPKAALLGSLSGWLVRVPRRVYVVRGLRFEGTRGRKRALLRAMEALTIWAATEVVVVSKSVGEVLLAEGLDRRPVFLVGDGSSNGVDAESIHARLAQVDRATVRQQVAAAPDAFVIGFVGRLNLDKGAEMLAEGLRLAALKSDGRLHLLVVGDVESERAQQLLAESTVTMHLTGWNDDPVPYLAALDTLVLPTKREGYPNVVLEANAAGVPVITTDATGARDSVDPGVTGLVVGVDDAPALAAAILQLQADEPARSSMAAAAAHRAKTQFAPSRIWDGLDGIYRGNPSDDVTQLTADRRRRRIRA